MFMKHRSTWQCLPIICINKLNKNFVIQSILRGIISQHGKFSFTQLHGLCLLQTNSQIAILYAWGSFKLQQSDIPQLLPGFILIRNVYFLDSVTSTILIIDSKQHMYAFGLDSILMGDMSTCQSHVLGDETGHRQLSMSFKLDIQKSDATIRPNCGRKVNPAVIRILQNYLCHLIANFVLFKGRVVWRVVLLIGLTVISIGEGSKVVLNVVILELISLHCDYEQKQIEQGILKEQRFYTLSCQLQLMRNLKTFDYYMIPVRVMKIAKKTWGARQYENNPEFKLLMDNINDSYEDVLKIAHKANLQKIEAIKILQRVDNDNNNSRVYCFYGLFLQPSTSSADEFYLHFIRTLEKELETMEGRFSIVFFNTLCESYRTFLQFKQMMKTLPIKYYARLDRLVVVHPSFGIRSLQWLSLGALNYLLYQHIVFANSLGQLEVAGLMTKKTMGRLPKQILIADKNPESEELEVISPERLALKKKISQKNEIIGLSFEQYEMNEIGIPALLKMLLSYFVLKPETLKCEGIFRKNVDSQLLDELALQCRARNYDFLNKVTDPHVVCGLIKKIFYLSKQPLFSYHTYEFVRAQSNADNLQLASLLIHELPKLNYRILQFIISFFKYKLLPLQSFNKMNEYNISVVFSPCIFRPRDYKIDDLLNSLKFAKLLSFIISNFQEIFGDAEHQSLVFRRSADEQSEESRNNIMVRICGKKYVPSKYLKSIRMEEILNFD